MQMTSEPHFQNSCEVYQKGSPHRFIVYGKTRDEVVGDLSKEAHRDCNADWMDEVVVTPTKVVAMGLPRSWARGARGRNEYGERE